MPKAPERNWPCYRARLSCKVGRDAIRGDCKYVPQDVTALEWAMFSLLHAVEDLSLAIEKLESKNAN